MKSQLTEISQKSQAESIDLWPEIYAELKETKTMKGPSWNHQLARYVTVFILFFLGALVVYAVVSQIYVDTGLEGERAERLVTPINMSITQGSITIRVDWAYADMTRISIGYTILDEEGNVFVPPHPVFRYQTDLWIREVGREGRGQAVTGSTGKWYNYNVDSAQQIYSEAFNTMEFPEEISESMELDFQIFFRHQQQPPIRFVFPITVYPAQFEIYDAPMVSENPTVPSYIREFRITPTITTLTICFDIPYEYQGRVGHDTIWGASNIKLYFDGHDVSVLYPDVTGYFAPIGGGWNLGCTLLQLDIPMDVLPETVRITFDQWHEDYSWDYPTLEGAEALAAVYQSHGLDAQTYDYHGTVGVNWPEAWWELPAFERQALYDAVMDDFFGTNPENFIISGPWEIEFELQDPTN